MKSSKFFYFDFDQVERNHTEKHWLQHLKQQAILNHSKLPETICNHSKPSNWNHLQSPWIIHYHLKLPTASQHLTGTNCNFFKKWDSLHGSLNSHCEVWSYKKKKHKKIKAYKKSVYKEHTVKRCLSIPDLRPFRSDVQGKHSIGREIKSLYVSGKKLLTNTSL